MGINAIYRREWVKGHSAFTSRDRSLYHYLTSHIYYIYRIDIKGIYSLSIFTHYKYVFMLFTKNINRDILYE